MTEIQFPTFTWQPADADAADQARRLGAAWAASGGTEPVPTRAAGPDDVVFLSASADLDARRPGPRMHLAADFLGAALAVARERQPVEPGELRRLLAASPWGTLALLSGRRGPDSVAAIAGLATALADHWDALDTVTYVHTSVRAVPLAEVVALDLGGLLATWLGSTGASIVEDVTSAAAAMLAADPDVRRSRVVARLAELAATNPRITHRAELSDDGVLADLYDSCDPEERDALAAGDTQTALTQLYGADRYL